MAAPTNVRSTSLVDPFLSFKFQISWASPTSGKVQPVAYVSRISALTRTTEVQTWREGGVPQGPRRIPGQTTYNEITLERGVTVDVAFEQWANNVWYYQNSGKLGTEVSLADFRKDLNIVLMNQAGQPVLSYWVFSCWPSSYTALPELDSNSSNVAIESMVLQNEGWARDDSLKAPTLPQINQPGSPLTGLATPPAS